MRVRLLSGDPMRHVDFFQLQRDVQERFVASTTGVGVPSVLLVSRVPRRFSKLWLVLGVAGPCIVIGVMAFGYGVLGHAHAILPAAYIAVHAVGLIAATLSLLFWLEWRREPRSLPYPMGVYLFPVGVVDATSSRPKVYPFTELRTLETLQARRLALKFSDGSRFEFDAQTPDRAGDVERQIRRFQDDLVAAQNDPRQVAALDPLTDSGVPNPLLPTTPLLRVSPWWLRWSLPLAVAIGSLLGAGLWHVRNLLSDRSMESAAVRSNTPEAYRAYLTAGGRSQAVSEVWLPRAELELARAEGTVRAVEQFAARHPNSRIAGEVTVALRNALLGELEHAKKAGDISLLLRMAKKPERHALIAPELAAAIHQGYQQALDRLLARVPDGAPAVHSFLHRLVSYAERHGPRIQVRLRSDLDRSVELLDRRIRRSPYRTAELPPAQYFDARHDAVRQAKLRKQLISRLSEEFPSDILKFEGAGQAPTQAEPGSVEIPTLSVSYTTSFTGAATLRKKKKGVYVPIAVTYHTTFELPQDSKPLVLKLRSATSPDLKAIADEGIAPKDLYARMTAKCDERFVNDYLTSLQKKS